MSSKPAGRGRGRGRGGGRGGPGGGGGGRGGPTGSSAGTSTLTSNLDSFLNKKVRVKLAGGREVKGTLKGHDQVANLVLDDTEEFLKDVDRPLQVSNETRNLGLVVLRGTTVMMVCGEDTFEEISNPFAIQDP